MNCFCPLLRASQSHSTKLHHSLISPLYLSYGSSLERAWLPHPAFILLATDIDVFLLSLEKHLIINVKWPWSYLMVISLEEHTQFAVIVGCFWWSAHTTFSTGHSSEFGMACLFNLLWNVKILNYIVNFNYWYVYQCIPNCFRRHLVLLAVLLTRVILTLINVSKYYNFNK